MKRAKPKVGQRLIRLRQKHYGDHKPLLNEVEVVKVGRVYFTVNPIDGYKNEQQYRLDSWSENVGYGNADKVYANMQDVEDDQERTTALRELHRTFSYSGRADDLSFSAVRRIMEIVRAELGEVNP